MENEISAAENRARHQRDDPMLIPPFPPMVAAEALNNLAQLRQAASPSEGPADIHQLILKVVGPCNLACDYCYEYSGEDDSWKNMPRVVASETVKKVAERAGDYASSKALDHIQICLHGGEPLMAGAAFLGRTAATLRREMQARAPKTRLDLAVQTNGTLLTTKMLEMLREHQIAVAVSLDGGPAAHDRHRVNKAGLGTYPLVEAGLNRLRGAQYRHLFAGLLCVIDIDNNPLEVFEALRSFEPPVIDFLLPYGTHDKPPAGLGARSGKHPYADWLLKIYDAIYDETRERQTYNAPGRYLPPIRLFRSIANLALGFKSETEAVGRDTGREVVIRSDGTYEFVDALKTAANGLVRTGFNVFEHDIETVASHMRAAGQLGRKSLAPQCQNCPFNTKTINVTDICGGGHVATRYSSETADPFANASVFCADLGELSTAIYEATVTLAANTQSQIGGKVYRDGYGLPRAAPPCRRADKACGSPELCATNEIGRNAYGVRGGCRA